MATITISTRFPVAEIDDQKVIVVVGVGSPSLGEPVSVWEPRTKTLHEGYYVTESEVMPANEVYESILDIYKFANSGIFLQALSREVGTDLPENMPITIYVVTKLEDPAEWDEEV